MLTIVSVFLVMLMNDSAVLLEEELACWSLSEFSASCLFVFCFLSFCSNFNLISLRGVRNCNFHRFIWPLKAFTNNIHVFLFFFVFVFS